MPSARSHKPASEKRRSAPKKRPGNRRSLLDNSSLLEAIDLLKPFPWESYLPRGVVADDGEDYDPTPVISTRSDAESACLGLVFKYQQDIAQDAKGSTLGTGIQKYQEIAELSIMLAGK